MPITESSAQLRRPVLRSPEKHQPAYSNIFLPGGEALAADVIAEAASLLKLSTENLDRIIAANARLPLACTASREEAELVLNRLSDLGLRTMIVSDEGLNLSAVKRVKSMKLDEQHPLLQQAGTATEIRWDDVSMIITGRLFVRRVEIQERKMRRPENEIINESEFTSDETVIDFYSRPDSLTWRVSANSFDFSCLGERMTLIANENIARLRRVIVEHATQADLDDSYNRLRPLLDLVWGPQQETQSSGWRRERPGKLSVGLAAIKSNEMQFTRYSRLQTYFSSRTDA